MGLRPGSSGRGRPPFVGTEGAMVKVSGTDTTPGYLSDELVEGQAIDFEIRSPAGDEKYEAISGLRPFYDDFTEATIKPFWDNLPVLTSLDWQLDAANDTLDGIAENNVTNAFRVGVEGDFDVAMRIDRNAATTCGLLGVGGGLTGSILNDAVNLTFAFTGEAGVAIATPGADIYVRLYRRGTTVASFYKVLGTDPWTLLGSYASKNMGTSVVLSLNSATGAEIHEFLLWDNVMSQRIRGAAQKVVQLTDAVTIAIDAARGNEMRVILGGNRTFGAPSNPQDGQRILFKVEQSGGGNTLAFNAIYRFSTDLPLPTLSPGAGAIDLLGFRYDADDVRWDYIAELKGY